MSSFRSLYHRDSLLWGIADQGMVSGANFASNIVLARALGLRAFGEYSLAWMVVVFSCVVQDALIVHPMLTLGPKQAPGDRPRYFGTVISFSAFTALAMFLVILGLAQAGGALALLPGLGQCALPLAGATSAFLLQNVLRYYFFTRSRPVAAFRCDAFSYFGKLLALLVLAGTAGLSVERALTVSCLASAGAVAVSLFSLGEVRCDSRVFLSVAARHWHFGKWLAGSALVRWVDSDWYTWMAGGLLGIAAVGALRAAQNISNLLQLFFMGLESVVTPRAAGIYHERGRLRLYEYMHRIGRPVGLVAALVITPMVIAPGECLRLFYGETYAAGGAVLRWLALSQGLVFLMCLFQIMIRTLEVTKVLLFAGVATVLFNLLASFPLVDQLGAEGAAIGILLGRAVWVGVVFYSLLPEKRASGDQWEVDLI
jgi:O-antigen/teichoic acid export membrane protein